MLFLYVYINGHSLQLLIALLIPSYDLAHRWLIFLLRNAVRMNKSSDENFSVVPLYHPYLHNVMASTTDESIPAMIKSTPTIVVVNISLFVVFAEVVWDNNRQAYIHPLLWYTGLLSI